jgi:hypothetical protein
LSPNAATDCDDGGGDVANDVDNNGNGDDGDDGCNGATDPAGVFGSAVLVSGSAGGCG